MPEDIMAANTTEEVVGNANPEQTDVTTETTSEGQASTEGVTQEQTQETTQETKQDVTQTQAFAHRLREETAKAAQIARDAFIAEQGYEWQGRPIRTEAEYKAALNEQQLLEKYKELPPEVAQKLATVDQLSQRLSSYERREAMSQQEQFLTEKPFFNDWKDDVKAMATYAKTDYATAYTMLAEQKMPEIIANYEAKIAKLMTNQSNASSSTGSVTGLGSPGTDFISKAQYDSMSMEDVAKNYDKVMASRKHWK